MFMFKKIKQSIFQVKILIIIFIVLIIVGWGLAIYFGLKTTGQGSSVCEKRLEKLHSYSVLLGDSMKLARENKSFDILEMDIRLLDNGSLLNVWENVVFGGNQKEDLDYYFDVIIDSLRFFSK